MELPTLLSRVGPGHGGTAKGGSQDGIYRELRARAADGVEAVASTDTMKSAFEGSAGGLRAVVPMEEPNSYTAVMVAAWGGVIISWGHGREVRVHPVLLFLLCVPVFITQVSSILYLRTDLEVEWNIYDPSQPRSVSLLKLKLVMVAVIYLANFKRLVTCISHFVFICNPLTWVEIHRPWRSEKACGSCAKLNFSSVPFLLPCALLALAMDVLVNYMVCVDAVSIILSAVSAKDAIFDSLAITFVVELSSNWWDFCSHTFVFQPIDGFSFETRPEQETWAPDGRVADEFRSQLFFPSLIDLLVRLTTPRCFGISGSFLRVGQGANRAIRATALFLLFGLFCRQFFVVLHAVDTLVLPAARDLCTEFQLNSDHTLAARVWRGVQPFMLVSFEDQLENRVDMQHQCLGAEAPLRRMTVDTMLVLAHKYSHILVIFVASVGGVLFLPTLAQASQAWCAQEPQVPAEKEVEIVREEVAEMRQQLVDLEDKVEGS